MDGLFGTVVLLNGPYFNFRAKIFHCPNEEIYGRKGPKWILVVQGRHMYEILQKESRFKNCVRCGPFSSPADLFVLITIDLFIIIFILLFVFG